MADLPDLPPAPQPPVRLGVLGHLRAFLLAMRDPGTPRRDRLAVLVALLYVLSPVDLVPEAIFAMFGLVDDAAVLVFLVRAVWTLPTDAHRRAAALIR